MTPSVVDDRERREFVTHVDGHRALLAYDLTDGVMTIVHTEVPPAIANRGIAAELTRAALRVAAAEQWQVVAACSYARGFLQRHGGAQGQVGGAGSPPSVGPD